MNAVQLSWFDALLATMDAGFYLGLVSCVLLALVAGLLLAFGQQVRQVKADLKKAPLLAEDLARQMMQAREALVQLQKAVKDTAPDVDKVIREAEKARQDLQFLNARAETLARQLEDRTQTVTPATQVRAALAGEDVSRMPSRIVPVAAAYGAAPITKAPVAPMEQGEVLWANGQAAASMQVQPEDPIEALIKTLNRAPQALGTVGAGAMPDKARRTGRAPASQAELELRERLGEKVA